jgi:undecaprenyl-diphosphatase
MDIVSAVILGVIQGLTEFLPISSSAHLVIFEKLLGFHKVGIVFEVLLHCATLLSTVVFFRKKIILLCLSVLGIIDRKYRVQYYENKVLLWAIIIGTIPTAVIGYFFNDYIDHLFTNITLVGYALILTSIFLILSDFFRPKGRISTIKSFFIGISQGFAVIPGISRSGITISTSLMMNVRRQEAAEFSFLLSIPSIIGAIILKSSELSMASIIEIKFYVISALIAFVVGLISIFIVVNLVKYAKFKYFALYCLIMGIYTIIWL